MGPRVMPEDDIECKSKMESKSHSTIMDDILHHVYTVLHDALYRDAYTLNLKRDEK